MRRQVIDSWLGPIIYTRGGQPRWRRALELRNPV